MVAVAKISAPVANLGVPVGPKLKALLDCLENHPLIW